MNECVYFSILGAALLLSLLGMCFVALIPGLDRWSKRFFLAYFVVILLSCLSCSADLMLYKDPIPKTVYFSILFLECLFLALPMPMLTVYLLHCCGEPIRKSKLLYAALGLWAAYLVLLACLVFTDSLYDVTPDNQYIRAPMYPILLLPVVALLMLNLAAVIRRRARLSRKTFLSFHLAIVPLLVSLIVLMFVESFLFFDISFILSALSMYLLILLDQIEQDQNRRQELVRQQLEIANQRVSLTVLQMRPHFIYNILSSIYCLCEQDPKLAGQVVLDFTAYLRKNFNAVASSAPVPFSSELEHTRAYLAVEKALYEEGLQVEYDTPHIMFRVPPLTLQPIVENAVKHGRTPYAGLFHISIQTRKTPSSSEIVVTDDGRGFDPAGDSEGHLALNNIRQRLEILCGGSLTITPNEGGGTVVTLTIPDPPAEEA